MLLSNENQTTKSVANHDRQQLLNSVARNFGRPDTLKPDPGASAILELIGLVTAEASPKAAQKTLTVRLQQLLNASEVAVAICEDDSPKCEIASLQTSDNRPLSADQHKAFETAAQESIARGSVGLYPAISDDNRFALLAHQQLSSIAGRKQIVSCPLTTERGATVGSLVATFSDATVAHVAFSFLFAASGGLAGALSVNRRLTEPWWQQCRRSIRKTIAGRKFVITSSALALAAAAMCVPVTYQVGCRAELQPMSRRYVAAPFAAPLKTCFVEPGDIVEANQTLATLNDTELQFELAGVKADLAGAATQRNGFLADRSVSDAEVAKFEMQRLQNQSSLLKTRSQRVDVCSPIDGVVVSGDLKQKEGVPLKVGETLFEIAPLDQLVIEVALPEIDYPYVQVNQTLTLRLDSDPSNTIAARILRIHPKAELRDHENVFIAEAQITNSDLRFRPGMKGDVKVATEPHPLGWNLFHKPVEKLIGWLGW